MFRLEQRLSVLLLLAAPAFALHRPEAQPEVDVCLRLRALVSAEVLQNSEATASDLFHNIGVRLHWSCRDSPSLIKVTIADNTPPDFHRGAFAYALPYAHTGERIVVFYDRLLPLAVSNPRTLPVVFGHILAHELGHVLCGVASHADAGLMRANWTEKDVSLMRMHRFRFTPEVAHFIVDNTRASQ